jgi:hypothetical protein
VSELEQKAQAISLCPITQREAFAFVAAHHRHHRSPRGTLLQLGAERSGVIVAVAIVGRPVARELQDGYTAEVTRLCSVDPPQANGHASGACSMLYQACWRACRALGYRRLVTYTLPEEGGASLRASGWRCVGSAGGGTWSRSQRPRVDTHPTQTKLRWEAA